METKRVLAGLGAWAAFGVAGLLAAFIDYRVIQDQYREVKQGWNLVPVVVAADDIPADTVVTYDLISQRPIPEQFMVDSIVKPDRANEVVGRRTIGPLKAGDALTWLSVGKGLAPGLCAHSRQ